MLWASPLTGLISLSDKFTTGSSMMPQKRNPDAAELVRAKTGRIVGALVALMTVIKGLPLAYAKDLQEDKEGTIDAVGALGLSLKAMTGMVGDLEPDVKWMRLLAGEGYSTATDLADWLVRVLKLTFREAHHITGKIVTKAAFQAVPLDKLPLKNHAGDRAAHHQSGVCRAVGREVGQRAARSMAAPRRAMSAAKRNAGSNGCGKSPKCLAMPFGDDAPTQCRRGDALC